MTHYHLVETCPICECPDTALVHIINTHTVQHGRVSAIAQHSIYRCNNCGLAYRDPLPTQADLDHYYQH